ncbi:MAG: glycosyltransferase [Flavobacteriia bacterium]|nr:glycosyltransferase [Flavobacteriia bacterium]
MGHKKRMVFITSRFPYPLDKGDKLRAYHLIKQLSLNYDIFLIALSDEMVRPEWSDELASYTTEIRIFRLRKIGILLRLLQNVFQSKPFQIAYFTDFLIQRKIKKLLVDFEPDHIFCQMIRPAEYVKNYHRCRKTIDYMDILSLGMERRALKSRWISKLVFKLEAQRLVDYEQRLFNYFEFHLMISQQDANGFPYELRNKLIIIPNGIDTEYFAPNVDIKPSFDLVFVGNLSYAPNIDAVKWMCLNILKNREELRLLIAGSDLSPGLKSFVDRYPNATILGWQEDIRSIYAKGKIFLAPMQMGTGLQNKILEAMAMQLPCITTSLASAAIPESPLIVANLPHEMLDSINMLLHNTEHAIQLGQHGRVFVQSNYAWETCVSRYEQIIAQN